MKMMKSFYLMTFLEVRMAILPLLLLGLLAFVGGERVMHKYRLPTSVEPTHYKLKILTTLVDDFNYLGEVSLDNILSFGM